MTYCWTDLGTPNGNGYRRLAGQYVHRWSWEQFYGPIPDGMVIDHVCRNRACWNPVHLALATNIENILFGESPPAQNARKKVCPKHGTPYVKDGKYRRCRACKQETRKDTKRLGVGRAQDRTHCPHGHPYDEENTRLILRPDGSVRQRQCRECCRQNLRNRRAAAKGR